eukprot:13271786-Ditylum_brightwellii.AAC.1
MLTRSLSGVIPCTKVRVRAARLSRVAVSIGKFSVNTVSTISLAVSAVNSSSMKVLSDVSTLTVKWKVIESSTPGPATHGACV